MELSNSQCAAADELKALIASSDEQRLRAGLMLFEAEGEHRREMQTLELQSQITD